MEQIVQRLERRVITARRGLCVPLTVALLSGCASTPSVVPVTRGESVALVVVKAAGVDGPARIDNLSLGSGAKAGLGSGLVVGAASGLGCGPFAFVCVPVGMFVGGLAGWGGGAVVGLTGALPDEKAAQLRQRVAQSLTTHDLLADLGNQVTERAGKVWVLSAERPRYQLTLELSKVDLTSTRDEEIGLVVEVSTVLTRQDVEPPTLVSRRVFRFAPPPNALGAWLDERSDFIDTMIGSCSQQLSAQIVAEYSKN
jgi:hypothetical protein